MPEGTNYWTRTRYGRRTAIRGAGLGVAGVAGAALIGCGGDDDGGNGGNGGGGGTPSGNGGNGGTSTGSTKVEPGLYEGAVAATDAEADPAANAKEGGTLNMLYLDPPRMDLNRTLSCTIYHTLNYTNNKLVRGRTGATAPLNTVEIEPDLAESWEDADNSTQFTFNLRQGVMTHNVEPTNGREFTSEDVVAGLEMYRAGGSQQDVFAAVTSIEAPDDYTVTISLDQPLADFPTNIASWSFIYLKELVDDDDLRESRAVGTGPFIQEEWTQKERSVFAKNPDYFEEGLPYVDELIAHVQSDVSALRAGFQTENFFYWVPRDDADAEDMSNQLGETMVFTKYPTARGANVNGFQFQMQNPVFQDERVRRALSMGIDRVDYDNADNAGDNQNPEGPFSNSPMPWPFLYDEYPTGAVNGPWYQHDAAEASKMLQAAGYTADSPLEFLMQSWYYRTELSELVIPGLNQKLPEVNISWREIDNPTHVTLMSDRNFDEAIGFLWGPPGYSMDQWIYPFLHSSGGLNYGSIEDSELDSMLEAQRAETDDEAKREIWQDVWDRIHDQVYQVWLPEPRIRVAWHNYMMNFRQHALMGSYTCYSSDQARAIWLEDDAPTVNR